MTGTEKKGKQAYRHILFDADGTFLASDKLDLSTFGISKETIAPFFVDAFPPTATGDADLKEVISPYLIQRGRQGSEEELLQYRFSSTQEIRQGMKELIGLLQQSCDVHLCTQQEQYRANYMMRNMGFETLFNQCFFTCELGYRKDDLRFFDEILHQLACSPQHVLFIDDKEKYCETAKKSGIQTYHFAGDVKKLHNFLFFFTR